MSSSIPLLILAAGAVGFLHSILPDHWVPLAVIARTQHWSIARVAQVSFLASVGHVLTSLVIAGVIAVVGLQFRSALETQQGHIVGIILVLTGIGFLIWSLTGHGGHSHGPEGHHLPVHEESGEIALADAYREAREQGAHTQHAHDHGHQHGHSSHPHPEQRTALQRFAAIAGPFGAAASPDLTILPVALAASAIGIGVVIGTLISFTVVTLTTFVVLTVIATLAGYQVKGEWLEEHGNVITAGVLLVIGIAVFVGL